MLLGMELADLDDATKKTLDVQKGVLVKGVEGDPAKSSGVEKGDLIMMFKGQHINNLAELNALSENIEEGKSYPIIRA